MLQDRVDKVMCRGLGIVGVRGQRLCTKSPELGAGTGRRLVEVCLEWFGSHALAEWRVSVPSGNGEARAFVERLGLAPLATTCVAPLD